MDRSFFKELKRRNVFKVAVAYIIVSWLIIQVIGSIVPIIEAPEWVGKVVFILLLAGFPLALIFAWAFELTPEGIKRESEVDRERSITSSTGRKIDFAIMGLLVIVLGYFIWHSDGANKKVQQADDSAQTQLAPSLNSKEHSGTVIAEHSDKSIAVLPFTNMAADDKNESFTLGIHDDLLTHLSKISALKVISRTSVLQYKNTQKTIANIAQELGVKNILEGSVQTAGQQIRINVQLIDAKTDKHLWAEIYDRELTTENIFNIQTEISTKIADALKAQLSPQEHRSLEQKATNNLEAYNAYLAGRQRMLIRTSKSLQEALKLFEKATELDPNYALAYVGQADVLMLQTIYSTLSLKEMIKKVEPLITKALTIEPKSAEANTAQAAYRVYRGQYQEAEKSYQYALSINPNYATAYHWYSNMLSTTSNRYQEAFLLAKKAANLDPLSPVIQSNLANSLYIMGRFDEANKLFLHIINFAPSYPGAYEGIANIYADKGQFDQAYFWMEKALSLDKGNPFSYFNMAFAAINLGDFERVQAIYNLMERLLPGNPPNELLQNIIFINQGKINKAIEAQLKLYQAMPDFPDQNGFILAFILKKDYQKAKQLILKQVFNQKHKQVEISTFNIEHVINLAWVYKQSGQEEIAKSLISKIQKSLSIMPPPFIGWNKVLFEAMQGQYQQAARAYAEMIATGSDRNRFMYQLLPYMEPVKQQPEYIKAHKIMMERLKQQRKNLAVMEARENNQ